MDNKAGNRDPIPVKCTIELLTNISSSVQESAFGVNPYCSTMDANQFKYRSASFCLLFILFFSNSLGLDQTDKMLLLIWIQAVCHVLGLTRV